MLHDASGWCICRCVCWVAPLHGVRVEAIVWHMPSQSQIPYRHHHHISSLQAGAGIVADSVPEAEYEETVNKAAALGRAIDLAEQAFVQGGQ